MGTTKEEGRKITFLMQKVGGTLPSLPFPLGPLVSPLLACSSFLFSGSGYSLPS